MYMQVPSFSLKITSSPTARSRSTLPMVATLSPAVTTLEDRQTQHLTETSMASPMDITWLVPEAFAQRLAAQVPRSLSRHS